MLWLVGLLRFMAKPQAFEGTRVGFHGERVAFACGRRTTRSRKGTGGLTDQIFFVVLSLLLGGPPVTAAVVARAVGPGPTPHSLPTPSAESAAPVLPPAPTSRWISAYVLGICVLVCAAIILVTQAAASETQPTPASSDVPEVSAAGSGLQAVRTSQAAGSTPLETGEPRSVPAQAPTVLDRATPTGLTQAIAPYLEGASVEVLATCFAEVWSRDQRQRLLELVEHRAAAAHAEPAIGESVAAPVGTRAQDPLASLRGIGDGAAFVIGVTPAHIAAQMGNVAVIQVLHELRADLDANVGATAAAIASEEGNVEVVRLLGKFRADLNLATTDGRAPAHIAAQMGNVEVLELLGKFGADMNATTTDGTTPAFVASLLGNVEVVRMLGALGADVNAATAQGATPIFIASLAGHVEVVRLLGQLGADVTAESVQTWNYLQWHRC